MSFIETPRFPLLLSRGAGGGPEYSTEIVEVLSGYEARNVNWATGRRKYHAELGANRMADCQTLIEYFTAMQGRAHGFRYKDWTDYLVTVANGLLGTGVATGMPTYQCYKRYTAGALTQDRKIQKLVSGTSFAYVAAVNDATASFAANTGIVTLTALSTATITAITKANPGQVTTSAPHGFSNGDKIWISSVGGMTQVNDLLFTIGGVAASTFTLGVDTTSYSNYTSGGTAKKYPQPSVALTWSGEFDVPVRFDTDYLDISLINVDVGEIDVPIIEIRI